MITIKIDPRDMEGVKEMLDKLTPVETNKAMARSINKTMQGVRTDGTGILAERFALTKTDIRSSFRISKASFADPGGVVSTQGTWIRLFKFGARPVSSGVSVKVWTERPRATIEHAFIGKLKQGQSEEQVYMRKWRGARTGSKPRVAWAKMPIEYRFPVKSLYGPRIQDYFDDPNIQKTLEKMTEDRMSKNMKHEIEYLLGLRAPLELEVD